MKLLIDFARGLVNGSESMDINRQLEYEMIKLGKYIHYKGNEYEVIGTATHSETLEKMVVYRALYGDGGLWVRPAAMWNEIVELNGKRVKRFTRVDDKY